MLKIKDVTDAPDDWEHFIKKPIIIKAVRIRKIFEVVTLEGTMKGKKDDFLIKGVRGELYPCDQSIFIETYNRVE